MKKLIVLLSCVILAGCASPPQRLAWVTGLKPEKADYYRELHAAPWPAVNRHLRRCNFQNFSIHECEIQGKTYLFAYLEYSGSDLQSDMAKLATDPETRRWWQETDPCQDPLPHAAAQGKIWADTREVYYLK